MTNAIYTALAAYLRALPGIAHVDLWNDQLSNDPAPYAGAGAAFPTPAIFVEFPPITTQALGGHVQRAALTPRLHLVTERYQPTEADAPDQAAALAADTQLVALVTAKLTGWSAPDPDEPTRKLCNSWNRTGQLPPATFTNVVETVQEWRTVAYDYSAVRTTQAIAAPSPALTIIGTA